MRLFLVFLFLSSVLASATSQAQNCVCKLGLGERLKWRWESLGSHDPAGDALELIAKSKHRVICISPYAGKTVSYQAKTIAEWSLGEERRLRRWYSAVIHEGGIRHLERLLEVSALPTEMLIYGDVPVHEFEGAQAKLDNLHNWLFGEAVNTILTSAARNPNLHEFLVRFTGVRELLSRDFPLLLRMVDRRSYAPRRPR